MALMEFGSGLNDIPIEFELRRILAPEPVCEHTNKQQNLNSCIILGLYTHYKECNPV